MTQLKTWTPPRLTVYGGVEALTTKLIKPKQLGMSDDFGVTGVSSP